MKRITTLLLAAVFALGSVSAAHADGIDVKVKGQWDFAFGWASNTVFKDSRHGDAGRRDNDKFRARQRVRTQVNFITSEYLQAVLMFEIGDIDWGRDNGKNGRSSGGGLDADGVNIETKRAYLDWIIPNTEIAVRMGIQGLTLPSTPMGSPVFDADVAGIVVTAPITDMFSVGAFWIRPFDAYLNDSGDTRDAWGDNWRSLKDEVDVFGLLLPVTGEGWSITPWGMFGTIGANSGIFDYMYGRNSTNTVRNRNSTRAWWVGAHMELGLWDPLVFNIEGIYGRMGRVNLGGSNLIPSGIQDNEIRHRGWFVGATLDYKLDWGVPGILGWYGSGDKSNTYENGKINRLPTFGNDGGSFAPTTFGTSGTFTIGDDGVVTGTGTGTWGVGIQLADMTFIEDLSHTLRVVYYRGTNHQDNARYGDYLLNNADGLYLTKKDSVIEVNFDHKYQIYENLAAVLELGYLHLRASDDAWRNGSYDKNDDAWKAQLMFQYKF